MTCGQKLETFKVIRNMPWKAVVDSNDTVSCHGNDDRYLAHQTATGALISG